MASVKGRGSGLGGGHTIDVVLSVVLQREDDEAGVFGISDAVP
jgi:hypothetical protein